ncbi:sulfatase [Jiangella aurantiaca]|uniref:Sulfatase n=1 Tax=Jiangella aurantiaca TaxID=2530373 RepID=A0A4R5ALJ4_9ACTN|nr:sulfatase [Jiangella aurantiaca]TDD71012.1 sulfatase [Jiangella aurantiaca]
MRAIVVMFDSLNRKHLPPYDPATATIAPNFERLAARSVTFDTCYAGSMPCMPARRELHTGRYNFLHRGWGPLEPFDDSVPEMLGQAGVTTHLATDHMHYWEDGGATYHTRYGTFSLIRGQQGDPWKGWVADPPVTDDLRVRRGGTWRQDQINRRYLTGIADHPQTRTFDAGLEFIADNHREQDWFVQIETFDPHEPFFSDPSFEELYDDGGYRGPGFDWPDYMQVIEDDAVSERVRRHYAALVSMCDASLGRVLDTMDEFGLWADTMLVVCTDHGFLLGEHGWWGKSVPPWYDETIHTPLFVWDPRSGVAGERRDALVQTIDLGPTLLDLFGVESTPHMQGTSLAPVIASGTPVRELGLFGAFGGHVSITDGRYVYMRACADESNGPLFEHTLMPTHMRGRFTTEELRDARLHPGFSFTKQMPVLESPGHVASNPYHFGTQLFDLHADPEQASPLVDTALELRMATALRDLLIESEAPESQFARLGLPADGAVTTQHLLCEAQRERVLASTRPAPAIDEFPDSRLSVRTPVGELMADQRAARILADYCRPLTVAPFGHICSAMSLYRAASLMIGVLPWPLLAEAAERLAALDE